MNWKDRVRGDLFGDGGGDSSSWASGANSAVIRDDDKKYVEIPEGHEVVPKPDGTYSIVPRKRGGALTTALATVTSEYSSDFRLAAIGTAGNALVNVFGLLPDATEATKLMRTLPKEGALKRVGWGVKYLTKSIAIRLLLGTTPELDRLESIERGMLTNEFNNTLDQSSKDRSDPDALLAHAGSVLGQVQIDKLLALADEGQYRSGPTTDDERHVATQLRADLNTDESVSASEWIEGELNRRFEQSLFGFGAAMILRNEYQHLKQLIKNPVAAVPTAVDGKVTLIKQSPWQQMMAALLGAKGFNPRSLAGGTEVFLDNDGKVLLQIGIERKQVAGSLDELLLQTDIADPFEMASVVATRKIDLGWISSACNFISTLGGTSSLKLPGELKMGKVGSDKEVGFTVANVKAVMKGFEKLNDARTDALDRLAELPQMAPEVIYDEQTFLQIGVDNLERQATSMPRSRIVLSEAQKVSRGRDNELFKDVGIPIPDENHLKHFSTLSVGAKNTVRESILAMTKGDVDKTDRAMAALSRQSRMYT